PNGAMLAELGQPGIGLSMEGPTGITPQTAGEPPRLLQVALANEISVSDLAAAWMPSTAEADIKITFAQQVGDEADHFRLVEGRLNALGVSTSEFMPPALNPLFSYLRSLSTAAERIA